MQIKRWFTKTTLVVIIFFVIVGSASPAQAGVWGEAIAATLMDQIITTVKQQIQGAILGTLKVAATELINSKLGQMIGGSTAGNARFVTDWNQFLYEKPAQETQLFMNDFFSTVTKGKYAQTNYVGIGDMSGGISGNYPAYLVERSKQLLGDDQQASVTPSTFDLDNYTSSPDEMIAGGDFRALGSFFTNPYNNTFGFSMESQRIYEQELQKNIEITKTKVISPGYIPPTDSSGKTIAPVETLKRMQGDAMNIGNQIIAAATNPGEFLAGVVGAMVNKTITNIIQRGVGKVQASIKKEISAFDKKVTKEVGRLDKQLGPAAKFLKTNSQRVDTKVKPYTVPPPAPVCGTGNSAC